MPLVKIEILKGKDSGYKRALLDGVHRALVDSLKVPEHDRMQRLYELNPEDFERSANKSENVVLIELTIFKGRSIEAKKKLYANISHNLKTNPGIDPNDVLIVINEPELYNWGVNGKPASEADLGFNINV